MKTHCTIVLGVNENGKLEFAKTFDYENEVEEAQKAFAYVSEKYPNYCMGKVKNLDRMISMYLTDKNNEEAKNKKLDFKNWKHSKGLRYLSGHTYKDNDGDLYDSDELESIYQKYLTL